MEKPDRPNGITAIALAYFALGIALILISAFNLMYAPFVYLPVIIGVFFVGVGYGTWVGMSWTWYVLTFGGGFFVWYFAKDVVKEYFGIEDDHDEPEHSGEQNRAV